MLPLHHSKVELWSLEPSLVRDHMYGAAAAVAESLGCRGTPSEGHLTHSVGILLMRDSWRGWGHENENGKGGAPAAVTGNGRDRSEDAPEVREYACQGLGMAGA